MNVDRLPELTATALAADAREIREQLIADLRAGKTVADMQDSLEHLARTEGAHLEAVEIEKLLPETGRDDFSIQINTRAESLAATLDADLPLLERAEFMGRSFLATVHQILLREGHSMETLRGQTS